MGHTATQPTGGTAEVPVGASTDPGVTPVTWSHTNFCPELDQVELRYTVTNTGEAATKVRLEFFGTVQRGTLGRIFYWDDTAAWKDPGEKAWFWSGETQGGLGDYQSPAAWRGESFIGDRFTRDEVTVQFSPYKVKVSLFRGETVIATGWSTPIAVTLHSIDLSLGPADWLSDDKDRYVRDQLAAEGLPARDQMRRVYLLSNQFKTSLAQMSVADAIHDVHRDLHGDGPRIPILATPWVKRLDGSRVDRPQTHGELKVLWDVTDVPEAGTAVEDFVATALDYHVSSGAPPGDNCHADRGGKRGASVPSYFEAVPGSMPTYFARCERRGWSATTEVAIPGEGPYPGRTGILFRPSRMAGDSFRVWCYLANERDEEGKPVLDTSASPLPGRTPHGRTGTLQVWRRIHVQEYLCKDQSLMRADRLVKFADVIRLFNKAFVQLNPVFGRLRSDGQRNPRRYTAEAFDPRLNAAAADYADADGWALRIAFSPDSWAQGPHGVQWLTYDEFMLSASLDGQHTEADALALLAPVPDADPEIAQENREIAYHDKLKRWSKRLLEVVTRRSVGRRGLHIFHFDALHNLVRDDPRGGYLQGWAPDVDTTGDSTERSAFILCAPLRRDRLRGDSQDGCTLTIAHEIGHLLYLPHAPNTDQSDPVPGATATLHDSRCAGATVHCMMGYDRASDRFCGLCQLRLRGWKIAGTISSTLANNRAD